MRMRYVESEWKIIICGKCFVWLQTGAPAMRQGGFKYGSYGFSGERLKERYEVINPKNNKANC